LCSGPQSRQIEPDRLGPSIARRAGRLGECAGGAPARWCAQVSDGADEAPRSDVAEPDVDAADGVRVANPFGGGALSCRRPRG
jgi:hypothetical protein